MINNRHSLPNVADKSLTSADYLHVITAS